jgi:uncharacterized membrane protein
MNFIKALLSLVKNLIPPPFPFTAATHKVTVGVSGEMIKDTEAEMRSP